MPAKKPISPGRQRSLENLKKGKATQFTSGDPAASKAGSKGAKRGHEKRREMRTAREMLEEISSLKPQMTPQIQAALKKIGADPEIGEYTGAYLMAAALQSKALSGDVKAYQMYLEIMGQDPHTIIEQQKLEIAMQNASHVPGYTALDDAVDSMMAGDGK